MRSHVQPDENLVIWSPDRKYLDVSSRTGNPQRIFRVELATGTRTAWKDVAPSQPAGVRLSQVTLTPDGNTLLHSYSQLLANLYVVSPIGQPR